MKLTLVIVAAAIVVFAADQDATKDTEKKTATDKKKAVRKTKDTDGTFYPPVESMWGKKDAVSKTGDGQSESCGRMG